ncbi:ATP-binding protein [Streptomyces oceani]|uniref:ATP-binding protein n=1 Tax=Streptomyces oceani TaxID=1075402 RepID=UPI0009A0C7A9|nr:ATP-binding protein [Streptomyces oceani]
MQHVIPEHDLPVPTFRQSLSSTPRGARLARLLGVAELRSWGVPLELRERAELVIAELASNASRHARSPGRDFRLGLIYTPSIGRLRVEVTDPCGDLPPQVAPPEAEAETKSGTETESGTGAQPDTESPHPGGWGLSLVTEARGQLAGRTPPAERQDGPGGADSHGRNRRSVRDATPRGLRLFARTAKTLAARANAEVVSIPATGSQALPRAT